MFGCKDNENPNLDKEPVTPPDECVEGEWEFPEGTKCLEEVVATLNCRICNEAIEISVKKKPHHELTEEKKLHVVKMVIIRNTVLNVIMVMIQ